VKRNHPGIFHRLTGRPFIFIGWVAAGGACLLLALLVFYPHRYATLSLLSDLKAGPKVFRTKIPEDILIAQNFFRGKFPVVNQPVEIPTKNESLSPVEKKAVPTLPSVELPEQREPNQETGLALPFEIQSKIETTPPLTTAVPTQSADLSSEKIDPPQEIAPYPPVEPQTKIETILPAEEPSASSQPIFAPSEQRQLPEKSTPARQKYARSRLKMMLLKKL
jgi:hypothetical protein